MCFGGRKGYKFMLSLTHLGGKVWIIPVSPMHYLILKIFIRSVTGCSSFMSSCDGLLLIDHMVFLSAAADQQ